MEHDPNIFRDSSQVIEEVEEQLERILQQKFRDVDSDLVERINREKEAARKRKEEIEREFEKEKTSLGEYRGMVRDFEEKRAGLLNEARDRFQKVLKFQAEIEGLAKSTVDEIKRVNDIQERLEALRSQTAERAAFLKNDLQERFGIVAEVMQEEPKESLSVDLDEELEKLRKIKDLLAIESAAASLGRLGAPPADEPDLAAMDAAAAAKPGPEIPGLQDLVAGPAPEAAPDVREEDLAAELENYRRTEPADGSGEIHYFQKGDVVVADPEKLLEAVDRTLEEGQRLSVKLGLTESPKDQFFIKQELINWQEGLRALFLRVVKMCEKSAWTLPRYTLDIVSSTVLRRLLERLSMENWSNLDEFAAFAAGVDEIRKAFADRLEPRLPYLRSLKRELEEG
jgi:uncharacterized membrane-anchored protein YhcB (DUF1043 family)